MPYRAGEEAARARIAALEVQVSGLHAQLAARPKHPPGSDAAEQECYYSQKLELQRREARRATELEGLRHQAEVVQRSNEAAALAQAWERSRGQAREAHQLTRWMVGGVTPDLVAQVRRVLREAQAEAAHVISASIKGLQGTVMLSDALPAYRQKWRMHRELMPILDKLKAKEPGALQEFNRALLAFSRRLLDVLDVEAPDVVLVDAAPASGGDGFSRIVATKERVAIGGTNPVRVDRVAAGFLGLWNNKYLGHQLGGFKASPLIILAGKRYGLDLDDVRVLGDARELVLGPRPVDFRSAAGYSIVRPAPSVAPP